MVMLMVGLFLLVAFAGVLYADHHLKRRRQQHRIAMEALVLGKRSPVMQSQPVQPVVVLHSRPATAAPPVDQSSVFFTAARHSPFDVLACLQDGDIDGARQALQKIAYMVHSEKKKNPDLVRRFTELMCMFARIDPLFLRCLDAITPVVQQTPGVLQTALYAHMPVEVEIARYVLYFADATGYLVRRKKGNSYEVFLPDQLISVAVDQSSSAAPVVIGPISLQTSVTVERDEVLAELNRRATESKHAGDWGAAVALLQQAKARQGDMYEDTRLALFLQQAGRFDEAMAEFSWLLEQAHPQCEAEFPHQSTTVRRAAVASRRARIHDKIRLACQRETRLDMADAHQALSKAFWAEQKALKPEIEAARVAEAKRWEEVRLKGPKSIL